MSRSGNESARARGQQTRITQGVTTNVELERVVVQLLERFMRQRDRSTAIFFSDLQTLLGERGKQKGASAVRREELLLNIKALPEVTTTPTAAQYNALVRAFNDLAVKLADIGRKQ